MPEAGWYEDPSDERHVRWWDGERWTARTAPAPGAEVAPRAGASPVQRGIAVAAVAVLVGVGAFLGARALFDDDDDDATAAEEPDDDDEADTTTSTAEVTTTATTVPTVEIVVGPTEASFVALIESIPMAEADVEAAAQRARDVGLFSRVLDSNQFTTDSRPEPLAPDLWILWTGPFPDEEEAQAFCDEPVADAGIEGCFVLNLEPA